MPALPRDLPVPSPSTSWESPTPAAPQSMETPHLGAPPKLMPTTTMSLVPGDTVMPPALFKVEKWYNYIGEWVILAFNTQRPLSLLPQEPVRLCELNPWMQFQKKYSRPLLIEKSFLTDNFAIFSVAWRAVLPMAVSLVARRPKSMSTLGRSLWREHFYPWTIMHGNHCSHVGPHLGTRVPMGTFFSFWVPKRSPFSFQGPHFPYFRLKNALKVRAAIVY